MKKLLVLCLSLLLALALFLPVCAAKSTVYDRAGLLDEPEKVILTNTLAKTPAGYAFFVVTATQQMTSDEVIALCEIDRDTDAVVLVIDSTGGGIYYYEMFTYNRANDLFSDSDVDAILDDADVYNNIKTGQLVEGICRFLTLSAEHLEAEEARIAARRARAPLYALFIGLGVGVVAGGVTALCVFLFYRRKLHGESYPLDRYASLTLTERQDRFVGSFVTRTRVQSSSSGGGSGGVSGGSRGRR